MLHSDVGLLSELEKPCYADLKRAFSSRNFPAKSLMFSPNMEKDDVFIVVKGRVRIYLAYESKEFTLAILERGDVYSTHTPAFISALEATSILIADTAVVGGYMQRIPELTLPMVNVLGKLLKHSIRVIDELAFKDVRRRLVEFLDFEASRAGRDAAGGKILDLGLTTEQIASILGTTRQTLSTLLNEMAKNGQVEIRGRGVFFLPAATRRGR
jgi:CRP-like cAMP-binding protein